MLWVYLLCLSGAISLGWTLKDGTKWQGVSSHGTSARDDLVTKLPGLDHQPKFKHYSGYLRAMGLNRLHYWFVESAGNPERDPVVLWLNGGPGCSSMVGLLKEHGPFLIKDGPNPTPNQYSWNRVANMLYLESPSGVGFSYSGVPGTKTSDDVTSMDNHWALKDFFKRFPQFAANDLYLTGQSYAGIYVPTLAIRLMDDPSFNLKGIAIGNGVHNFEIAYNSRLYYGYYHGLIGITAWNDLLDSCCDGDDLRCNFMRQSGDLHHPDCAASRRTAYNQMSRVGVYSIYEECPGGVVSKGATSRQEDYEEDIWQAEYTMSSSGPCTNRSAVTAYLNRDDVRRALHVPDQLPPWKACSRNTRRHYDMQYKNTTEEILKILRAEKYRVLLYNGDWDMLCSFLGAQWFVNDLDLEVSEPHTVWQYTHVDGSQQVAGFVKVHGNLTVATVQGAGHSAPTDKPLQTLKMFTHFLKGESFGVF